MSVGQPFKSFNLYDILASIVPGAATVLAVWVVHGSGNTLTSLSTGVIALGGIVLAFVVGQWVQWMGSGLEGQPTLFGETVHRAKRSRAGREDSAIPITEVEERFWSLCQEEFGLSEEFSDYGRLFELVASHLEGVNNSRSSRFQALYTFHRSMWAASLIVINVCIFSAIFFVATSDPIPIVKLVVVGGLAVISVLISEDRKEKFNKVFVRYFIADFYTNAARDKTSALVWKK